MSLIYFCQLSNGFKIAIKLHQKMSHASSDMNMTVCYIMLSSIVKWFEFSKTNISQNVTSFKKYEYSGFLPNAYY